MGSFEIAHPGGGGQQESDRSREYNQSRSLLLQPTLGRGKAGNFFI